VHATEILITKQTDMALDATKSLNIGHATFQNGVEISTISFENKSADLKYKELYNILCYKVVSATL
jgi:hypothetical protein